MQIQKIARRHPVYRAYIRVYSKLRSQTTHKEISSSRAADSYGEFAFRRTEGAIVEYESIHGYSRRVDLSPRAPNLATTRDD